MRTMSRRAFVHLAAAGFTGAVVPRFRRRQPPMSALAAVDHLIVGVADLDAGIRWFEQRTGVRPAVGGVHPGRGTRNALIGLGGKKYLELLSVDPAQDSSLRSGLLVFKEPRLIGWAAAAASINDLSNRIRSSGLSAGAPRPGSRTRPDGTQLKWTTLTMDTAFKQGELDPFPFFIEWDASSRHPAEDSPKGCELVSFDFEHPDPDALRRTFAQAGIDAPVRKAAAPALHARLRTPKGEVALS
jgi:hypothetical protein